MLRVYLHLPKSLRVSRFPQPSHSIPWVTQKLNKTWEILVRSSRTAISQTQSKGVGRTPGDSTALSRKRSCCHYIPVPFPVESQSWAGSGCDLCNHQQEQNKLGSCPCEQLIASSKGSHGQPSEMVPPPPWAASGNREPISELKWGGTSGHSLPDQVSSTGCSLLHLWHGTSLALIPEPTETFTPHVSP